MNASDPITVLVVDDDDDLRAALADALESDGVNVVQAGTGRDALEALRGRAPNAVLLDVMMNDMNGQDVYRAMQADPSLAKIPVVVMTAQNAVPGLKHLRLLRKPVETHHVSDVLRAVARATQPTDGLTTTPKRK